MHTSDWVRSADHNDDTPHRDATTEQPSGIEAWERVEAAPWNQAQGAAYDAHCMHGTPVGQECGACQAEAEMQADAGIDAEAVRYGSYRAALVALLARATRSHHGWSLGGFDGPDPWEQLENALQIGLEELQQLRTHEHQWGENGYCDICGLDGRA